MATGKQASCVWISGFGKIFMVDSAEMLRREFGDDCEIRWGVSKKSENKIMINNRHKTAKKDLWDLPVLNKR